MLMMKILMTSQLKTEKNRPNICWIISRRFDSAHFCERCVRWNHRPIGIQGETTSNAKRFAWTLRRQRTVRVRTCELVERAQSRGDDTHVVVMGPKWARGRGFRGVVWSQVSVGGKSGPSIGARRRARAEVNVRPRPFVKIRGVTKKIVKRRAETTTNTETSTCKHEDRHSDHFMFPVSGDVLNYQTHLGSSLIEFSIMSSD